MIEPGAKEAILEQTQRLLGLKARNVKAWADATEAQETVREYH